MNFLFVSEIPPVKQDKWFNAAVKLREVVGEKEFTVYSIMDIFRIDGTKAMTLLHYLTVNRMITPIYK